MGGWISNLSSQNNQDDEDNLRRYQEKIDGEGASIYSEPGEEQETPLWKKIYQDTRVRIGLVLFLCLILGILIPFIIFFTKLDTSDHKIYGSCLIQETARFQCLINSVSPVNEKSCTAANCCWENSLTTPFKCYYSLPSAYQYTISRRSEESVGGNQWVQLSPTDRHNGMTNFQACIHWESNSHLAVALSRKSNCSTTSSLNNAFDNIPNGPFNITWDREKNFFYLWIKRNDTGETVFDTRLGPVIYTDNSITFSTLLPTPYFYGLKGGLDNSMTYGIINGFNNAEYPFYISYEKSGRWHGVLLDTFEPMIVQILRAPGIMFHLESELPELTLHFFGGPTQQEILTQLHLFIRQKYLIDDSDKPYIPPFWGLGLHLCRLSPNSTTAIKDIEDLTDEDNPIPYDSDCIDEKLLLHPNAIDEDKFSSENITTILKLLEDKKKKVVISQQVTVPSNDTSLKENNWILEDSTKTPFIGTVDDEDVNVTLKYIDVFRSKMVYTPTELPDIHGITLNHNFPKLYNASGVCAEPKTKLQSMFMNFSSGAYNSSVLWSVMCPESLHDTENMTESFPITKNRYVSHLRVHNLYGEIALIKMAAAMRNSGGVVSSNDMMISATSTWISSMYHGASRGLQVPFTWQGLQESVAHVIRNYALAPIIGTPICGSMIWNVTIPQNDDLCLRWFQFGLLLPFSVNSYDGNSSYGPTNFQDQYKGYLTEAIHNRYSLAPYYRTVLHFYREKLQPFIAPTSFYFNTAASKGKLLESLDQFMIGEAILAAPIIQNSVYRQIYFPAGIWYAMDGSTVWNRTAGNLAQISGLIYETPIFLRGGTTLPILQNLDNNSIVESLANTYTLFVALDHITISGSTSRGTLVIKDADVYYNLEFFTSVTAELLNISISILNSTCDASMNKDGVPINTVIDDVEIFGYAPPFSPDKLEIIVKTETEERPIDGDNFTYIDVDDKRVLQITDLKIDWCNNDAKEYSVIIKEQTAETPPTGTTPPPIDTTPPITDTTTI